METGGGYENIRKDEPGIKLYLTEIMSDMKDIRSVKSGLENE